jgi:hypothetical protein
MVEINEVLFPENLDSVLNFPNVTEVTEATGEDINRNRDAILVLERTLGKNPHIGLFTDDPNIATVSQRIGIIENGIAEGRFAFRNLNVNNALVVRTDTAGFARVDIGGNPEGTRIAPVFVRGPLRIMDSGITNNEMRIDVPFISSAKLNVISAGSLPGEPLLRITDTAFNPAVPEKLALLIEGNVLIRNGRLTADFALEHSKLRGIDTTPRAGVTAIHVTRGDFHSHKRKRDPATGALLNEVESNPTEETFGLIDHEDLLNIHTKTSQASFEPVSGVAYHVTGGDDHDHKDGRGAQIDHNALANVNPATSNHITGGDRHAHTAAGDGAPISHSDLLHIGFLSHPEIDQILNVEFKEHLSLIDPENAEDIPGLSAFAHLGFHVPLGHVSDPNAHHARYTDEEALAAQVLISADTTVYEEGRKTNSKAHIQAIGSGVVSSKNAHGVSAADIGALEGFDPQGNLPEFTKQFLETALEDILQDPAFNVPRLNEDELVTGLWTFSNIGGIVIQSGSNTTVLNYAIASKLADTNDHANNIGTAGAALPATSQPPFHHGIDIDNVPAGNIASTNVQAAINELDSNVQAAINELDSEKEPTLSVTNQVISTEIANDAVITSKILNANVTLAKLANQYALCAYSFAGEVRGVTTATDSGGDTTANVFRSTRKFGFQIPTGAIGSVVSVSVMRHLYSAGATSLTVQVEKNAATILTSSPTDIVTFTTDSPAEIGILATSLVAGDDIVVTIAAVGTGADEVSVTVNTKYQHVA